MNQGLPIPNMSAAMSAAIRSLAGGEQGNQLLAILQQVMASVLSLSCVLRWMWRLFPSTLAYGKTLGCLLSLAHSCWFLLCCGACLYAAYRP